MEKYYYISIGQSSKEIPFIESFEENNKRISLSSLCGKDNAGTINAVTKGICIIQDLTFPIEDFVPFVSDIMLQTIEKYENNLKKIIVNRIDNVETDNLLFGNYKRKL
jgi:hypothetical protein